MIRVVIDTNILVSALLRPLGLPAQVFILALSGSLQLCVSGEVYAEYEEVINRLRFQRPRFQRDQETVAGDKRANDTRRQTVRQTVLRGSANHDKRSDRGS